MLRTTLFITAVLFLLTSALPVFAGPDAEKKQETPQLMSLSLEECIALAVRNNHQRPASRFGVEMAEAQHRQALSAFWPQLTITMSQTHLSTEPNFIFPAETVPVPAQAVTIPANAFAPGFPQQNVQLQSPPSTFTVPQQNVKLMDRDLFTGSLGLQYPLYTGGLAEAKEKQAAAGLEIARQEARRTDLQVSYDVKRMYYGALLSREVLRIARDALARLSATLELTEHMFKNGSGSVKKTDYLRNKVIVETMKNAVAEMEGTDEMARSALVNTMGLPWNTPIALKATEIPYEPYQADLSRLVNGSYEFNPDWQKFLKAMEAADAGIQEARSGYLPKLALQGSLNVLGNSYEYGIVSANNKNTWSLGLGLSVPVFDGMLSVNKVKEAQARLNKMKEEKILFQEGLALQIKQVFIQMMRSQKQDTSSREAFTCATENRNLNEKAYKEELVKTQDVIEAQIMESFMEVQYLKAHYDHVEAQTHLDYIIGREVLKVLGVAEK